VSVKARDNCRRTPFLLAAKNGTMDMVMFLVGQWPEGIAEGDHYSKRPLHSDGGGESFGGTVASRREG
jgi:ankyrin repeat protein